MSAVYAITKSFWIGPVQFGYMPECWESGVVANEYGVGLYLRGYLVRWFRGGRP